MQNEIVHIVNDCFSLAAREDNLMQLLEEKINYLIINNFNKLIYLLYRADINETKLNKLLADNKKENAGKIIAALFIERQIQKIKSREEHKLMKSDFDEEERW
jgi:hypothetical protein